MPFFSKLYRKAAQVLPANPFFTSSVPSVQTNISARPIVNPMPPLSKTVDAIATQVSSPIISILNQSTVISDEELQAAIGAIQIQLDRDFAPAWGLTATLQFLPKNTPLPVHHWMVVVMDTTDQAGTLGYHDITEAGMPIGKIFAKDDQKYGLSWTVTLSHEVLEETLDPYIANCVFVQNSTTTGTLYAFECSDPVEDDDLGYEINGILVSNFVFPSWFEGFRKPNSTQFDFCNKTTKPFELATSGYISTFVVGANTQGWNQINAELVPSKRLLSKGDFSRMNRRAIPKILK
jgi:hypothetical protein